MKNIRIALALFAVIALGFTTSAAFADTAIALHSNRTVTVAAADGDGNAVVAPLGFQITSGGDVCTGLQVSPSSGLASNQALVMTGSVAGTCTLTVTYQGTVVKTESISVPPGPPVTFTANWQ